LDSQATDGNEQRRVALGHVHHVRVAGGGGWVGVAEQLMRGAQIAAMRVTQRRRGMAQGVAGDAAPLQARKRASRSLAVVSGCELDWLRSTNSLSGLQHQGHVAPTSPVTSVYLLMKDDRERLSDSSSKHATQLHMTPPVERRRRRE